MTRWWRILSVDDEDDDDDDDDRATREVKRFYSGKKEKNKNVEFSLLVSSSELSR